MVIFCLALISRSMRDNAPLTPPPEAVRRSSIVQLQACSGPLSRLCLALTKVGQFTSTSPSMIAESLLGPLIAG